MAAAELMKAATAAVMDALVMMAIITLSTRIDQCKM
jgi:hypothetical protein